MSWERDMLLAIHGWSTPALDVVFLVSGVSTVGVRAS